MRPLLKRLTLHTLPLAFCLALLLIPDLALANTGTTNEPLKNFAQIAASLVQIIAGMAIIIVQFMPALWGSELITGDTVMEGLSTMWVYVRNLTNIAFVGVILYLAMVNMVSSGKGIKDWSIKTKLGKVILGLVAINFSLLGMRVLVDVVHVGTVALLSIADPIIEARGISNIADYYERTVDTENFQECETSEGGENCKPMVDIVNGTFCAGDIGSDSCMFKIKAVSKWRGKAEAMTNPERRNIMLAFGTFFMKLESLPMLSAESGGLINVLDSTLFSLVFGLAYLLALVAIFIALLIRVVMMWVFIIFSPMLVAAAILGIGAGASKFTDQFVGYLLLPLKAAAALAFGFVMLATLETMQVPSDIYVNIIEPGPPLKKFWGDKEFAGFHMLWKVLTVVLFWKVVFDFALSGVEGVSGITDSIKGFGKTAGTAALTFGADQVQIPGFELEKGKNATLASFMKGGALAPGSFLQSATTQMRREGGSGFDWRKAAGSAGAAGKTADRLRRVKSRSDAEEELGKISKKDFLDDFSNSSLENLKHYKNALKLIYEDVDFESATNRNQLEQAILKAEGSSGKSFFKEARPSGTSPETVNVNGGAVSFGSTNITLNGGDDTRDRTLNALAGQLKLNDEIPDTKWREIHSALSAGVKGTDLTSFEDFMAKLRSI